MGALRMTGENDVDGVSGLTRVEALTMDYLVDAYAQWVTLPNRDAQDNDDFVYHLHALQSLIAVRLARRAYPQYWRQPYP